MCDASLRRLRVDTIDLYQLHAPDPKVPFEDSIGALVELRDEGKLRHIGLSNVNRKHLAIALAMTPVASVQNRYNPSDRSSERVLEMCEEHGWRSSASGRLTAEEKKAPRAGHRAGRRGCSRSPVTPIPARRRSRTRRERGRASSSSDDDIAAVSALAER